MSPNLRLSIARRFLAYAYVQPRAAKCGPCETKYHARTTKLLQIETRKSKSGSDDIVSLRRTRQAAGRNEIRGKIGKSDVAGLVTRSRIAGGGAATSRGADAMDASIRPPFRRRRPRSRVVQLRAFPKARDASGLASLARIALPAHHRIMG